MAVSVNGSLRMPRTGTDGANSTQLRTADSAGSQRAAMQRNARARNATGIPMRALRMGTTAARQDLAAVKESLRRTGEAPLAPYQRVQVLDQLISGSRRRVDALLQSRRGSATPFDLKTPLGQARADLASLRAARVTEIQTWMDTELARPTALREVIQRVLDQKRYDPEKQLAGDPATTDLLAMIMITEGRDAGSNRSQEHERQELISELRDTGRPLFIDDEARINFDPENLAKDADDPTRVSRLGAFQAARSGLDPVYRLTHHELLNEEEGVRFAAQEQLAQYLEDFQILVEPEIWRLREQVAAFAEKKYGAALIATGQRTKTFESAEGKLRNRYSGRTFNDINDVGAANILARDMVSLERTMRAVEEFFGDSILEKENMFFDDGAVGRNYEAIHYVIQIDNEYMFELHLKTHTAAEAEGLDHDLLYKVPEGKELSSDAETLVRSVQKRALGHDHHGYLEADPDLRTTGARSDPWDVRRTA